MKIQNGDMIINNIMHNKTKVQIQRKYSNSLNKQE